jgi:acyl-coenzyme A thioesterase PaaI-like protein
MPDFPAPQPGVPADFDVTTWRGGFGNQVGPIYQRFSDDGTWARGFLVTEKHTNGFENCHGGMLMAFADMAFGSVVTYELHRF